MRLLELVLVAAHVAADQNRSGEFAGEDAAVLLIVQIASDRGNGISAKSGPWPKARGSASATLIYGRSGWSFMAISSGWAGPMQGRIEASAEFSRSRTMMF